MPSQQSTPYRSPIAPAITNKSDIKTYTKCRVEVTEMYRKATNLCLNSTPPQTPEKCNHSLSLHIWTCHSILTRHYDYCKGPNRPTYCFENGFLLVRKLFSVVCVTTISDLKFNKILAWIQPQYHVTKLVVTWYNKLLTDWSMPYNSQTESSHWRFRNQKPQTSIWRFSFLVFGCPHWWFFHGFENGFLFSFSFS